MASAVVTAGRPVRKRRSASAASLTPASSLGLGVGMLWFSLLVLIPLAAIVVTASEHGLATYKDTLTDTRTFDALKLTVGVSVGTTAINMVMGTLIAWVLVRDRFPGKWFLELLVDVPFAMPTIVAGLVLLSLYGSNGPLSAGVENSRKAVFLAILFVTLPFIVRTVQPVLEEMDTDAEDAAASLGAGRFTTFRRVIFPTLAPAVFAGAALSFARGISEYGSLVLLSGNLPSKTEVVSYRMTAMLENGSRASAAALATVMLLVALVAIVALELLQRTVARRV